MAYFRWRPVIAAHWELLYGTLYAHNAERPGFAFQRSYQRNNLNKLTALRWRTGDISMLNHNQETEECVISLLNLVDRSDYYEQWFGVAPTHRGVARREVRSARGARGAALDAAHSSA